jgi:hypothetical protein
MRDDEEDEEEDSYASEESFESVAEDDDDEEEESSYESSDASSEYRQEEDADNDDDDDDEKENKSRMAKNDDEDSLEGLVDSDADEYELKPARLNKSLRAEPSVDEEEEESNASLEDFGEEEEEDQQQSSPRNHASSNNNDDNDDDEKENSRMAKDDEDDSLEGLVDSDADEYELKPARLNKSLRAEASSVDEDEEESDASLEHFGEDDEEEEEQPSTPRDNNASNNDDVDDAVVVVVVEAEEAEETDDEIMVVDAEIVVDDDDEEDDDDHDGARLDDDDGDLEEALGDLTIGNGADEETFCDDGKDDTVMMDDATPQKYGANKDKSESCIDDKSSGRSAFWDKTEAFMDQIMDGSVVEPPDQVDETVNGINTSSERPMLSDGKNGGQISLLEELEQQQNDETETDFGRAVDETLIESSIARDDAEGIESPIRPAASPPSRPILLLHGNVAGEAPNVQESAGTIDDLSGHEHIETRSIEVAAPKSRDSADQSPLAPSPTNKQTGPEENCTSDVLASQDQLPFAPEEVKSPDIRTTISLPTKPISPVTVAEAFQSNSSHDPPSTNKEDTDDSVAFAFEALSLNVSDCDDHQKPSDPIISEASGALHKSLATENCPDQAMTKEKSIEDHLCLPDAVFEVLSPIPRNRQPNSSHVIPSLSPTNPKREMKPNNNVTGGDTDINPVTRRSRVRREGSIKRGQWRLVKKIGAGSFGIVHMGINTHSGAMIAVKSVKMDPVAMKDSKREIQLMKALVHDNVVKYFGAEMNGTHLHIFQEWIPAGSIASLLAMVGPFPLGVLKEYLQQALQGLAYLHANNIMHRDIKGSNLLVTDKGVVKLADFGAGKQLCQLRMESLMAMTCRGSKFFFSSCPHASVHVHNTLTHRFSLIKRHTSWRQKYLSKSTVPRRTFGVWDVLGCKWPRGGRHGKTWVSQVT